jgi:hypothetical protein
MTGCSVPRAVFDVLKFANGSPARRAVRLPRTNIMRTTITALLAFTMLAHCDQRPERGANVKQHVIAARSFTTTCAASRLAGWNVRGSAAGNDCGILLIETPMILEDAVVEAMHYGTGAYDLYKGGVNQFGRARGFRGIAYRDGSGQLWRYGNVSQTEAESLKPCH